MWKKFMPARGWSAASGKKTFLIGLAIVLILAGASCEKKNQLVTITSEEARVVANDFINNYLMQPGTKVTIKEITDENGLYKLKINIPGGQDGQGQEIDSYLSKDGKKFFTSQALDIAEVKAKADDSGSKAEASAAKTAADVPKAEKAKVELFVMSHCPYGTQIEKGILPVIKTLGDSVDFELKFCDYAMHGEKEAYEQLNQYCIQKEEPAKLIAYLECFLEASKGEECLVKTRINQAKLKACAAIADKEFNVTANLDDRSTYRGNYPSFDIFKADNLKYSVQGSPTLVINGVKVPSGRDSATLLKNICSGYENPPAGCTATLSSAAPSPGFGSSADSGGGASNASCGN